MNTIPYDYYWDDECPICFESLLGDEALVWCETTCGNNIHKECMDLWISQARSRDNANCPLCRTVWVENSTPNSEGQYTNLSHLTGQSKVRKYERFYENNLDEYMRFLY